jgi:transketolase
MAVENTELTRLKEIARVLRVDSLKLIHRRGAGHPGGALSSAEIMAVLYFHTLRIDPHHPADPNRDRFILSKGHASALLYAALSKRGFFSHAELDAWGEVTCTHQGHPDRLKTPGVDMTSGILGHGIAVASGLALAARQQGMDFHTYTLLGDGECQGGIVWEGINTAAKFKLDNVTAIVDCNNVQLDGCVDEIMPMEPLAEKWRSFNWHVLEIDGHTIEAIINALESARSIKNRPTVVLARTIKGKGVSFMEGKSYWHGNVPNAVQLQQALLELGEEVK